MAHDELARTDALIARCETRITEHLQRLARLSPWEPESACVREELHVEERVLRELYVHQGLLLTRDR